MPFICIGGLYQWSKENKPFSAENIKKYFGIFGTILICVIIVFVANKAAYSAQEWKTFEDFCTDRATVYDYAYVPEYEGNKNFYEENDISFERYCLLRSYDFSLDSEFNADIMKKLAEYSEKTGPDLKEKLNIAIGAYRIQLTEKIGTPYHSLILVGYLMLLLSANKNNRLKIVVFAGVLFLSRSFIWLYLLGQGRVVARVIHPLYWGEFILLLAMTVQETWKRTDYKKFIIPVSVAVLCVVSVFTVLSDFNEKYKTIHTKAEQYEAVQKYCVENKDNFYFIPVYSLGVLPEKVFDGCSEPLNMELLGGWHINSPVYNKKMNNNSIDNIDEAILNKDNVYIIQHSDYISYDTEYPFQWLTGYYAEKGYDIEIIKTDTVVDNVEVYKIEKLN